MILLTTIASLTLISFLLKVGFLPAKWIAAIGLLGAVFMFVATPAITELSQQSFLKLSENPTVRTNAALIAFVDSAFLIAFCFTNTFQTHKESLLHKAFMLFLQLYPGLLFFGALCFFEAQMFFSFAGIDFKLAAWLSAILVFSSTLFCSVALKKLIGERHNRTELLFMIQIFIIIIGIFITGK